MGAGVSNFVFFVLIYDWLNEAITSFGDSLMGRFTEWASLLALLLVTIWIMLVGYHVIMGTLREPLMAIVVNMARIAVIVTVATSMSLFGTHLNTFFNTDLNKAINQAVTGSNDSIQSSIDKNLVWTEIAMSAVDAVKLVPSDTEGNTEKNRAMFWAGLGTAGPALTAAVMLLMYQFALALFIGLGPLFILCLIFDQTKGFFAKWLYYGIGTLFSMAFLNVVTSMVLQLSTGVAAGMWTAGLLEKAFTGGVEGVSHVALEQGGIGLILTMPILTVPPMGAMFFNSTVGQFMYFSAFRREGEPGPRGEPPGAYRQPHASAPESAAGSGGHGIPLPAMRGMLPSAPAGADEIRRYT